MISLKYSDMARASQRYITVLPATHIRTVPAVTNQPQGVTALWRVLTAPTNEGTAGLS